MTDRNMTDLTSRNFMSQRLRLHYVDWGNAGAPPLILVHGNRDHCRSWDWVATALCRDYHVIAPDLRGHGDSQWSPDGNYSTFAFIYDLAQLIHQQDLAPATIIAHSMGAKIALRYAGLYPENVARLVAIEGLGLPPARENRRSSRSIDERMREWVDERRALSGRQPRRYASVEQAFARLQEENSHLSTDQARHLTLHGVTQNEDGSYSWKFDNFTRTIPPIDMTLDEVHQLWSRIACPTLLVHGSESWGSNPVRDRHMGRFGNARAAILENAGHWVHHDQLDRFLAEVRQFLS